jgi:hypothetical protein
MADQHTARWRSDVNVTTVKRGFVWEIDPMLRGVNRRCEDLGSPLLHPQGRPKRATFAGSTAAEYDRYRELSILGILRRLIVDGKGREERRCPKRRRHGF